MIDKVQELTKSLGLPLSREEQDNALDEVI